MKSSILRRASISLVLCLGAAGCGTDADLPYLLHLAGGLAASYGNARPIECVLADGAVTPEQADKLRLVLALRTFAADRLGMTVGDAYANYEDNTGNRVAYAVTASARDRFEPYRWNFPIVGLYDAKGYFDRALAQQEADRLAARGYDVFVGEVLGFATFGILPDPVRASNLELDDFSLAELILHELTHNTVFKPDDTDFNESMATYVGRVAAWRYYEETFGVDSSQAADARRRIDDLKIIDTYVIDLYLTMRDYYDQPLSSEEKIAGRAAVFDDHRARFDTDYAPRLNEPQRYGYIRDIPLNNAVILAGVRYQGNLDLYEEAYAALGRDIPVFLALIRDAVKAADSRAWLAQWLAARP